MALGFKIKKRLARGIDEPKETLMDYPTSWERERESMTGGATPSPLPDPSERRALSGFKFNKTIFWRTLSQDGELQTRGGVTPSYYILSRHDRSFRSAEKYHWKLGVLNFVRSMVNVIID